MAAAVWTEASHVAYAEPGPSKPLPRRLAAAKQSQTVWAALQQGHERAGLVLLPRSPAANKVKGLPAWLAATPRRARTFRSLGSAPALEFMYMSDYLLLQDTLNLSAAQSAASASDFGRDAEACCATCQTGFAHGLKAAGASWYCFGLDYAAAILATPIQRR